MILDNENNNLKVHEWISQYTENGTLDIVTVGVQTSVCVTRDTS
jgi:hypothetical protein